MKAPTDAGIAPGPALVFAASGRGPRRRPLINLTPLIDVVFILLVFFMLATRFHEERTFPVKALVAADQSIAGQHDVLSLALRADGFALAGATRGPNADVAELVAMLRSRINPSVHTQLNVSVQQGTSSEALVRALAALRQFQRVEIRLVNDLGGPPAAAPTD